MSDNVKKPEKPEEPEAPPVQGLLIQRTRKPGALPSVELSLLGDVDAGEVQTVLELAIKSWRQQIGLPAQ